MTSQTLDGRTPSDGLDGNTGHAWVAFTARCYSECGYATVCRPSV